LVSKLIIEKNRILSNDYNICSEQIKEMDDHIHSMMTDKKWNINFNVEWSNKLKNIVTINKQELSAIPPEKRIQSLQLLLESKRESLEILKKKVDEKHDSLLKDIDEQIQYYIQELRRINDELKNEKSPVKRFWKDWKKDTIQKKSAK
jgi:hypothetical protein